MESNQISQDVVTPFFPLSDAESPPENLNKTQNRSPNLTTEFSTRAVAPNGLGRLSAPQLPQPKTHLGDPAYEEASKALDKLNEHVGTDMQSLMTFFHEIMVLMRKQSRENRALMRDAQMNELQEAADKIRSAAKKQLIAGVAMGALTMAAGAFSMRGAAKSASSMRRGFARTKATMNQAKTGLDQARIYSSRDGQMAVGGYVPDSLKKKT